MRNKLQHQAKLPRKRARQRELGATMAESVIVVPLFIFLIFLAVEFMILSWRALSLQFVATQTMRNIVTGMCDGLNGDPPGFCEDGTRRVNYAIAQARELSSSYGLGASPNLIVCIARQGQRAIDCPDDQISGGNSGSVGQIVEVTTAYESPLLFRRLKLALGSNNLMGPGGAASDSFALRGVAIGRVEVRQRN